MESLKVQFLLVTIAMITNFRLINYLVNYNNPLDRTPWFVENNYFKSFKFQIIIICDKENKLQR